MADETTNVPATDVVEETATPVAPTTDAPVADVEEGTEGETVADDTTTPVEGEVATEETPVEGATA